MAQQLLTTAQVAKRMRRSRRWVQDLILRGLLKAEKVGSTYAVRLEDVRSYRHQSPGRPALNGGHKNPIPPKSGRNGNGRR